MSVPQAEINTAGVIIALSKLSGLSIVVVGGRWLVVSSLSSVVRGCCTAPCKWAKRNRPPTTDHRQLNNSQFGMPAQTCAILTERLDYAPRWALPPMKLS